MVINGKLRAAMVAQFKAEFDSALLYMSMRSWFEYNKYSGMAHWMRIQSSEESEHAMKIFEHIMNRGGRVIIPTLAPLKTEWSGTLEIWKEVLAHEQKITASINSLITVADANGDRMSNPFLYRLLEEQIEEEKTAECILDKAEVLSKTDIGLITLDRQLGERMATGSYL